MTDGPSNLAVNAPVLCSPSEGGESLASDGLRHRPRTRRRTSARHAPFRRTTTVRTRSSFPIRRSATERAWPRMSMRVSSPSTSHTPRLVPQTLVGVEATEKASTTDVGLPIPDAACVVQRDVKPRMHWSLSDGRSPRTSSPTRAGPQGPRSRVSDAHAICAPWTPCLRSPPLGLNPNQATATRSWSTTTAPAPEPSGSHTWNGVPGGST